MVRLGELVGMNQGGTPRKEDPEYWGGSIPFLTGADLTDFRVGRQHARSFLTDAGLVSGHTAVCEAGTLLLATRTRVGLAGIATELMGASQDITCLYPDDQIDSEFLCHTLLRLAPELQRLSRGTTIQGITREDMCSVPVLIPPLSEQRAIADALDSIDEAIERTEAVIAATETLRDSLLHELLTRSLPGWHTEWKEVPGIGTIPADWEVVRLGDVAEVIGGSTPSKTDPELWEGNIPWVVPSELTELSGRYLETTKPKPRWDVHLPGAGNRGGSLAGVFRPLIAGPSGSAVSPRLSGWTARPGICRPSPARPSCSPGTDCQWPPLSPSPR